MFTIDARHNGPPASGHGGITSGLLAASVDSDRGVVVRLHSPVPLDTPLQVLAADDGAMQARAADTLVATARPAEQTLTVGSFPDLGPDDIAAAEAGWVADRQRWNPFPTCFGCGTARLDGWRLSPGLVPGSDVHATSWTARFDGGADPGWAAWGVLDCTQVGPVIEATDRSGALLTGELALRPIAAVQDGVRYVALSRLRGRSGRKVFTEGALLDPDGQTVAVAHATWFTVDSY